MSPDEASMQSSTIFTSVPSSSTQLTPLVGTAIVLTVLITVAPNASLHLISPIPVSTPSADSSITFTSIPSKSTQSVSPATIFIPSSTSSAPSTSVSTSIYSVGTHVILFSMYLHPLKRIRALQQESLDHEY